ncbi:MAG: hypothetical protein IJ752_04510 [Alphaproteobacteria bacterium]|nr:hypothetical protein [Alphaproteobacteria bacterium]
MKNIHSQESGRSMIEMLGVLAIIGVLSVGGIAGYSQAMNKFKVTKTTDQIQTLITNIRTLTASQRNYDLVNKPDILQKMGALTDEMCSSTTCSTTNMVNPYGGDIKIATYDIKSGDKKAFYVAYQGLPNSACVSLATQSWGDASSGLVAIQTASTALTPTSAPTATTTAGTMVTADKTAENPMPYASASTGCGDASVSTVVFFYK